MLVGGVVWLAMFSLQIKLVLSRRKKPGAMLTELVQQHGWNGKWASDLLKSKETSRQKVLKYLVLLISTCMGKRAIFVCFQAVFLR